MYRVTQASIEVLSLPELFKARDAIKVLENLDIRQVDVDVKNYVNLLISKKEQSRI